MPYRFKIDEPVEKGFRRIAREQLDLALTELGGSASAAQGRARVPQGVEAHQGARPFGNVGDRDTQGAPASTGTWRNRPDAFGSPRSGGDARNARETHVRTGSDAASVLAPLRAHLTGVVGEGPKPLDADCAAKARLMLLREAQKFARMRFRKRGFAALEGGLEKSYRRARNAIKMPMASPPTKASIRCVRRSQWHWRQMSLLGRAWPDEFAVRVTAARELSQILGDDHDLAMLIDVDGPRRRHIRRGQRSDRRVMSASPTCVAQRRRTTRRAPVRREVEAVHKANGRVLAIWPRC